MQLLARTSFDLALKYFQSGLATDVIKGSYMLDSVSSMGVVAYSITEVLPYELADKMPSMKDIGAQFLKYFQYGENEEHE